MGTLGMESKCFERWYGPGVVNLEGHRGGEGDFGSGFGELVYDPTPGHVS